MRRIVFAFWFAAGCGGWDGSLEATDGHARLSADETAILAVVNDPQVSFPVLDVDVGLDRRAASYIIRHRVGPDGQLGTRDDGYYESIDALDAVPYVGSRGLEKLLAYARDNGYWLEDEALEERRVLRFVNDPRTNQYVLDELVGLDRRAARAIVDFRQGPDGLDGSADDQLFESIERLEALPYVGPAGVARLAEYARANGY